jgi:hypothetical protein
MGTIGARGLQRKSLSSKRAQQSIKSLEAQLGVRVSSDTSDNSTSQETPSEQKLGNDNEGSLD